MKLNSRYSQDFALDSMENLLFSIARFKECVTVRIEVLRVTRC